jgi:hypothetical protein
MLSIDGSLIAVSDKRLVFFILKTSRIIMGLVYSDDKALRPGLNSRSKSACLLIPTTSMTIAKPTGDVKFGGGRR